MCSPVRPEPPIGSVVSPSADPGTIADDNFAGAWARMAEHIPGGWTTSRGGVTVAATGIPLAPFNLAFLTRPVRHPERALQRAIDRLDDAGLPYLVRIRRDLDDAVEAAGRLGLHDAGDLPGMTLAAIDRLPGLPPGIHVARVDTRAEARDHLRVAADAFSLSVDTITPLVSEELRAAPGFEMFVAYRGGAPVATSALCITGETVGIYNVAVPAAERGRGLGAGITAYAIRRGAIAHGARTATLQASEMGRPVYERMGFVEVRTYAGFVAG